MKVSWVAVPILFFSLQDNAADANINSCAFLSGAPIVDIELPSLQHTLKFLGVEAKVYRHVLSAGSTPRLRFIRYSSTPIIDIVQGSNEVLITSEETMCVKTEITSSSPISKSFSTMFVTALLASFASTQGGIDSALGILVTTILFPQIVAGQKVDGDCTPVLEVVLEAPPYYMGSVAACRAEVENPDHCPEDFPEFPECSDPNPTCKLAVVGAGTGGLYTAMRLVDEGVFAANDICIFEATERVGGRIYSLRGFGPENDLTVDAGAYRTWPNFTVGSRFLHVYLGCIFSIFSQTFCSWSLFHSLPHMHSLRKSWVSQWHVTKKKNLASSTTLSVTMAKRLGSPLLWKP